MTSFNERLRAAMLSDAEAAENKRLRAAPATAPEFPADWAQMIHYPECWDTAAYPELRDAIHEALAWSGCSVCKPATAPPALAGQGATIFRQLSLAVERLILAQTEMRGRSGPKPSEIAHSNLMQLIQHVCIGIDSPPRNCPPRWVKQLEAENELLRKDAERKPMTHEEAVGLINKHGTYWMDVIRATEAFHDIKGTP